MNILFILPICWLLKNCEEDEQKKTQWNYKPYARMHAQTHNYTHSARNQLMKMCVCVVSAMVFFTKIKSICWETTKKMKTTTKAIKLEFYVCENEIRETNKK